MKKILVIAAALLLVGLEAPLQAEAADAMRPLAIGDYFALQSVGSPRISPDAKKDWNVPIINSEQMYQGMKSMGRETLLVVYPDADHGVRRPIYQKDLLERFLGWFDKYVKQSQPANQKE